VTPWFVVAGEVVSLSVVVLSMGRLAGGLRGRQIIWDSELLHLAMGVSMAGMLAPGVAVVPSAVWLGVFALGGCWFAGRASLTARRGITRQFVGTSLVRVGGCAAMVYMFLVVPPAGSMPAMADLICGARMLGMSGTSTAGVGLAMGPAITAVGLGAVLLAGIVCLHRPSWFRRGSPAPTDGATLAVGHMRVLRTARLSTVTQGAMCLTMAVMLVALYR
jgi:hypothetical protein